MQTKKYLTKNCRTKNGLTRHGMLVVAPIQNRWYKISVYFSTIYFGGTPWLCYVTWQK